VAGGDVTLTGGGTVTLSDSGANQIRGPHRLINVDNVIQGGGDIGLNEMALTNQALIDANVSQTLEIDPNTDGVTNTGTLRASGGGTLKLANGSFTNTDGLIQAQAGSTVVMSAAAVTGGTLQVVGSGEMQLSSASVSGGVFNNSSAGIIRCIGGTSTIDGVLSNPAGGQIIVGNGNALTLAGTRSYTNAGDIRLDGSVSSTRLNVTGTVTLGGGGTVTLGSFGDPNYIRGSGVPGRLVNADNTMQGRGYIGSNEINLTNAGLVDANVAGNTLTVDPEDSAAAINTGVMQASGGGTLKLTGGTFTNTGATIQALDASTVDLSGVTIIGGTLDTAGSGLIRGIGSVVLQDLTHAGQYDVKNGRSTTLKGTIHNTGTIAVNASASATYLRVAGGDVTLTGGGTVRVAGGDVTLTGGGTVTLSDSGANQIRGPHRLINVDNVIRGAGRLGNNSMELVNQGTVEATGANVLTVDLSGTAGMINDGLMRAVGAGGLYFADDAFTNADTVEILPGSQLEAKKNYVQTAGTTQVVGLLIATTMNVQGGSVLGTGTLDANVNVSGGSVAPGPSPGVLAVDGNVTFTGGSLDVEIASAGSYDRLAVTGNAALSGTLAVTLTGGYVPGVWDEFTVLTAASVSGQFAAATGVEGLGGHAGLDFAVIYAPDNVTLSATAHPGDANLDAKVNVLDLAILANNYNGADRNWLTADFTGDGVVNVLDLAVLANNYNWSGAGGGAGVPEPATLALLAVGGLALIRRKRSVHA
jgi:hypothetical protein